MWWNRCRAGDSRGTQIRGRSSLGVAGTTEWSCREGCEVPAAALRARGPAFFSPPPTGKAGSGTFRRPRRARCNRRRGARGACRGLHCVAAGRPRAPGHPPRGRGLRPPGPRVGVRGGLGKAWSLTPLNRRWGGSMAAGEAAETPLLQTTPHHFQGRDSSRRGEKQINKKGFVGL